MGPALSAVLALAACEHQPRADERSGATDPTAARDMRAAAVPGDLVLRRSTGVWGDLFADLEPVTGREFSHAGVVAAGPGGTLVVVHAEADDRGVGVVGAVSFEEFASGALDVALLRPPWPGRGAGAAAEALRRLGTPFDPDFDADDGGTRLHCGELVWRAWLDGAGIDLAPGAGRIAGRLDLRAGKLSGMPGWREVTVR